MRHVRCLQTSLGRAVRLPGLQGSWRCSPWQETWAGTALGSIRLSVGSVFHARMRPEERMTLRAVRDEMRLRKKGIARFNKRWRSWAQNRVRQFRLPLPVTLTSDTALMDANYITACVQKAAALRKHDVKLWFGYSKRILELREELQPDQLGYIMWGYGKSSFLDASFYREILPTIKEQVPNFQSHALMSLMWCLKRIRWHDGHLNRAAAQHALDSIEALRPSDFIKVTNALAQLGLRDTGLREALSRVAVPKLEETFAQQFRDAVNPVTIGRLWNDEVTAYLLERFRKIFITARPMHLLKAYESAVVCRIQRPQVWRMLSKDSKSFYVRLSQRHIADKGKEPSQLHWDVSRHLADLGEAHRNSFRWGPLYIDIGLEQIEVDERRRCVMVDGPSSFFYCSDQYLPAKHLQHETLTSLGWDVRRVRWDDWLELGNDDSRKRQYLQTLIADARPVAEELRDRAQLPLAEVQEKLRQFRRLQAAKEAAEAAERSKIDFEI
ncbi:ppa1 [Symbiodinium necroappetens]|uniref:Ppa1 protein n=1 Tax=Symbiodinium necroappetens TaxID=1628268 RepID=A0A813A3Y8_9DINO|nr:ppa1 [Symbiodinium necroappetens]